MAELITMPKLSDTMEEGAISEWLKKEGEQVKSGDALVSIETDKATIEYASPEAGVLLKIIVAAGAAAPIQAPIAIIGKKGEDYTALLTVHDKKRSAPATHKAGAMETTSPPLSTPLPAASEDSRRLRASPLARKMAKAEGFDLRQLTGSGPHGRIVRQDVDAALHAGSTQGGSSLVARAEDQRIPVTMMRKTIAKRLVQSKNEAPHYYLKVSANVEQLLTWRQYLNGAKGVAEGTLAKVSINDILLYLTARVLRLHPEINASWLGDTIVQHGKINLAMAVALPQGLISPVLNEVDRLALREIATLSRLLVKKAEEGRLLPQDYQEGTFTISNLGMTVVEDFTAIINPPQAAILAVGKIRDEVVVGARGDFRAQKRLSLTLSCDHRVIDGMMGAQFLNTLVSYLENPLLLLA